MREVVTSRPAQRVRLLLGASLLGRGVGLASSLVLAGLLGPARMGVWSTLRLLLSYAGIAHLGALEGLRAELPRAVSLGRRRDAVAWRSAAELWVRRGCVALGFLATGAGSALWASGALAWDEALALVLLGPSAIAITWSCFLSELLTAREETGPLASLRLRRALWHAALLPLGALWGGVLGCAVALALTELRLCRWLRRVCLRSGDLRRRAGTRPLRSDRAREIVRLGLPVTAACWSVILMGTVDRLLVLGFLGAQPAGFYAIGALSGSVLLQIPEALSRVHLPALVRAQEGSSVPHRSASFGRLWRVAWVCSGLAAVGACLVPFVLPRLLPSFAAASGVTQLLLVGAAFACLIPGGIDQLLAEGRQRVLLHLAPLGLLLNLAASLAAIAHGLGVEGVALATCMVQLLVAVCLGREVAGGRGFLAALSLVLPGLGLLGGTLLVQGSAVLEGSPGLLAALAGPAGWALGVLSALGLQSLGQARGAVRRPRPACDFEPTPRARARRA